MLASQVTTRKADQQYCVQSQILNANALNSTELSGRVGALRRKCCDVPFHLHASVHAVGQTCLTTRKMQVAQASLATLSSLDGLITCTSCYRFQVTGNCRTGNPAILKHSLLFRALPSSQPLIDSLAQPKELHQPFNLGRT